MLFLLIILVNVCAASLSELEWTGHRVLDPEGLVHLQYLASDDTLTLQVTARTLGYVAIGFSSRGGMKGADVILGWVDEDQVPHVEDRFARDYVEPELDEKQDVELLGGSENGTHTVLRFRRKYVTCDSNDYDITNDTVRVLYALHSRDPDRSGRIMKHEYRGSHSMLFKNGVSVDTSVRFKERNVTEWDVRNIETTVSPDVETLYWCTVHKAPVLDRKHHIVAYEALLDKGAENLVHHILLYACLVEDDSLEKFVGQQGYECYTRQYPEELYKCTTFLAVYSKGGEGMILPENVGLPIGDTPNQYFMLEIHYDNYQRRQFKPDTSGLRFFLTPELRENDGWALFVGHEFSDQIIPPRQSKFLNVGHCSSQCTQNLPAEGITVTHAQPHMHNAGAALVLRHIRNGTELAPINEDQFFDFNFQLFRELKTPIKVLPGDHLIAECTYDSSKRSHVTFGGLSTEMEMCDFILYYYPKTNLAVCGSVPSNDDKAAFFGYKKQKKGLLSELPYYASVVEKFDFDSKIAEVQHLLARGRYENVCVTGSRNIEDPRAYDFPEIKEPYVNTPAYQCNAV